jgi:hypothetical protein
MERSGFLEGMSCPQQQVLLEVSSYELKADREASDKSAWQGNSRNSGQVDWHGEYVGQV